MNWFANHAFGSHAADWLALVVVIALALCLGTVKFVFWLHSHERDTEESDREYWRMHGGE